MPKEDKKKLTINDFRSKKTSIADTIKPTNWLKAIIGNILKIKDNHTKYIENKLKKISNDDHLPWYTGFFSCFHPIKVGKSLVQRVKLKKEKIRKTIKESILKGEPISPINFINHMPTVLDAIKEKYFPKINKSETKSEACIEPKKSHSLFSKGLRVPFFGKNNTNNNSKIKKNQEKVKIDDSRVA